MIDNINSKFCIIKSIEDLNKIENYKYQNDSFKHWCESNQGRKFYILDGGKTPNDAVKLKGINFLISKNFLEF